VRQILAARPGQVTFNTVFYGAADAQASGRLSLMARTGNGYFLDTNTNPTGKDFLISNIVDVPGSACRP
jgi:predicted P-loop ATPase